MYMSPAQLLSSERVLKANVYRVPHTERLLVALAPHGLKIETTHKVQVFAYSDPHVIPGNDTAPMLLRGESFCHQKHVVADSEPCGVLLGRMQPIASAHPKAQT